MVATHAVVGSPLGDLTLVENGGCLTGNFAERFALQEAAAQIDEQHFDDAGIGQIERIAKRRKEDEQREPLRRQHAGKHEGLQNAGAQSAGRGRARYRVSSRLAGRGANVCDSI